MGNVSRPVGKVGAAEPFIAKPSPGEEDGAVERMAELRRWFSWPWYWSDSLVDDLIGQGRLRRVDGHIAVADHSRRPGEAPRPAASRDPA